MNTEDSKHYLKAKRDQFIVQIRKDKNESFLIQKRIKLAQGSSEQNGSAGSVPQKTQLEIMQLLSELATNFFTALKNNNFEELANITEKIRRAISLNDDPPIDELISTGVVPHIIKLLDYEYFQHERLVIESAWIIANIASAKANHVNYIIQLDAAQKSLNLLDHDSEEVKDNAVWILANMTGDSFPNRDALINLGIVEKLTNMVDGHAYQPSFLGHVAWLISNLCRGKPFPPFEKLEPLLPLIQFFVHRVDNDEVINHTMWALSYLSDGSEAQIKAVLELDVASHIVKMMGREEACLKAPALRAAGNLLTEVDELTAIMIEAGVIPALANLLSDPKNTFRKEACWGISNILAGNKHHIEEIFLYNNRAIIKKLFQMIYNDAPDIGRECFYCLTNICSEGSMVQVQILVEHDFIELIIDNLRNSNDANMIKVSLEALDNLLFYAKQMFRDGPNPYLARIAESNGYTVIENLQTHLNNDIYNAVSTFITRHMEFVDT